jgi:hypothetical protein
MTVVEYIVAATCAAAGVLNPRVGFASMWLFFIIKLLKFHE